MKVRIETPDGESHEDHDLPDAPQVGDRVWFGDEDNAVGVVTARVWDLAEGREIDLIIVTTAG